MIKTIEIIISPTGQTRLETKGFTGTTCQGASKFLEQALGKKLSETATAEAHGGISGQAQGLEQA